MNDIPYENFELAARKAFKVLLDHKYVYQNELITEDAVVHIIAGEMSEIQKETNKNITIDLIQLYLPSIFEKMVKEANILSS